MTDNIESDAAGRDRLAAGVRRIAIEAGEEILRHYSEHKAGAIAVRRKDDESPVTAADEAAEVVILRELADLAPDIPAVSEESASRGVIPKIGRRFWLVDPLDGTREFLDRNGEFTVNIALIEDGTPVLGVVYAPAKGRLWLGRVGGSAFEQDVDPVSGTESAPRPIRVRVPAPDGLIVVASRSHRNTKTDEYLRHYRVKDFLTAGSSLKFCLVANGEADLYPRHGDTMEWDVAAGHAVLVAAGGAVTDLDGKPLTYGKSSLRNPWFVARGGGG
jgi:3'(2'), 5'-bisphosphate nucleotidase